jgi:hypothetical protein
MGGQKPRTPRRGAVVGEDNLLRLCSPRLQRRQADGPAREGGGAAKGQEVCGLLDVEKALGPLEAKGQLVAVLAHLPALP